MARTITETKMKEDIEFYQKKNSESLVTPYTFFSRKLAWGKLEKEILLGDYFILWVNSLPSHEVAETD